MFVEWDRARVLGLRESFELNNGHGYTALGWWPNSWMMGCIDGEF